MNSETPVSRRMRPEAGVVSWERLNSTQQTAFKKIVDMIAEAVEDLDCVSQDQKSKTKPGARLPRPGWLDDDRPSRTVLLDGDRGTGKTTVLLSIVSACTSGDASLPTEVKEKVDDIKCRLLWLEPIDMDPLPGPTNLLAAVLARIDAIARQFVLPNPTGPGQPSEQQGPAGILELCPDYLDTLQDLQRLQTDVALAWDGNLPGRGEHLDPDAYAVEVLRAELARLSLTKNLATTLDRLAEKVFRSCGVTDPLFVLPIDDVDLNPLRSLEVLRLLRTITVPRLFMLVLGDVNMVEVVLNLKYSGEFSGTVGANPQRALLSVPPSYVKRMAATVASKAMRKLLPPAQRVNLGVMDVDETLEMRPPGPGSAGLLRLGDLLRQCPVLIDALHEGKTPKEAAFKMAGLSVETVPEFLLFPSRAWSRQEEPAQKEDDTSKKEKPTKGEDETSKAGDVTEPSYYGKEILRMSPRRGSDWWFFLEELNKHLPTKPERPKNEKDIDEWKERIEVKWREAVDLLGRDLRSAINEDVEVDLGQRQKYRDALRRRAAGDWELPLPITVLPKIDLATVFSSKDSGHESAGRRFFVSTGRGWSFYPYYSDVLSRIESWPEINRSEVRKQLAQLAQMPSFSLLTTSVFLVFHDLLALGPEWRAMARGSMRVYKPFANWAVTEWKFSPTEAIWLSWPVPSFSSLWEHDIFLAHWNTAAKQIRHMKSKDVLTILIYTWIDAAAAVLQLQQPLRKTFKPEDLDWGGLSQRLVRLHETETSMTTKGDLRGAVMEDWLLRLGAFLMPEFSGLDETLVGLLCRDPGEGSDKLREFWRNKWHSINQFRDPVFDWFNRTGDDRMKSKAEELKSDGEKYFSE